MILLESLFNKTLLFCHFKGATPPYGSTTGVLPTGAAPTHRDSVLHAPVDETHHNHHHHGPHPPGFSTSHLQPPLRNAHPPERPRRPPSISDGNNRPHVHNDHQHHNQHHHPNVPETIHPHEAGAGHEHENPNNLPPPPPPVPVIVDQLHRDNPIPG